MVVKQSELFAIVKALLGKSYTLPLSRDGKKPGTGAPGTLLESMLGVEANSTDGPDVGTWEVKYHGGGSSLLTMLHKTPSPTGVVKQLIDAHGWQGRDGRLCFRHTIHGKQKTERGFFVVNNKDRLEVRHTKSDIVAYWTHDDIINAASKMRRLLYVTGRRKNADGVSQVCYKTAQAFTDFKITNFIPAAVSGVIKVDFDARYKNGKRDSGAIRDHGTKLRIHPRDLPQIYGSVEDI